MAGDLELLGPRPRGRPTLYLATHCERVIELATQGWCKAEIAAELGVGCTMLDSWAKAHPEFREALRRAKDLEYAWWLKTGREEGLTKNWNLASWELQMRNRFGRRFTGRGPTRQRSPAEPKDSTNAERIREEIERKLSRIADAGAAEGVSREPDAAGGREPGL